jgi:hypothetical protein
MGGIVKTIINMFKKVLDHLKKASENKNQTILEDIKKGGYV